MPKSYQTSSGLHLGRWVHKQRTNKESISSDRVTKLNQLNFEWEPQHPFDLRWEQHFTALEAFRSQHGHCRVSKDFTTPTGLKLGAWVVKQATTKDKMKLDRRSVRRVGGGEGGGWEARWVRRVGGGEGGGWRCGVPPELKQRRDLPQGWQTKEAQRQP